MINFINKLIHNHGQGGTDAAEARAPPGPVLSVKHRLILIASLMARFIRECCFFFFSHPRQSVSTPVCAWAHPRLPSARMVCGRDPRHLSQALETGTVRPAASRRGLRSWGRHSRRIPATPPLHAGGGCHWGSGRAFSELLFFRLFIPDLMTEDTIFSQQFSV